MRFLTIALAIIFLACTCKDKSTSPLRKKKANKIVLGAKKADSIMWRLVKTYDPYQKGYVYIKDSTNYTYLVLKGDGSFKEYDQENLSKGLWYLNKDKSKLGFLYQVRNGLEIKSDLQNLLFRHHVDTLYKDTLILAIQGRHGMVKHYYQVPSFLPIADSMQMDSSVLPVFLPDTSSTDSLDKKLPKN